MTTPTSAKASQAHGTPTVSYVGTDGLMVELLHDAEQRTTTLAIAMPGEPPRIEPFLDLPTGERLVPYSASNNLLTSGCVLLPSAAIDFGDKAQLLEEIRAFLRRYVALTPVFEEIAAHYAFLTWVYDAFNELPYLRFRGDYGTGKTRALLAVGSLCYKPFFASGASTVSPIFHVLDVFGATLILDEADFRFSDATAELTKVLNNGNVKGLPVLRTMSNRHRELNPQAFRVFGPKIVAMRERFSDRALESRFLTEETGSGPLPADIPIHLPDSLKIEALALRNKLLAWRFSARHTVGPDPGRLIAGIEPRLNQTALALLSLIDEEALRAQVRDALVGEDASRRGERLDTEEGQIVRALAEAFEAGEGAGVRVAEIASRLAHGAVNTDSALTNKRIGWVLRNRLHIASRKSNGAYLVPSTERARVMTLAARYGVAISSAGPALSPLGINPEVSAHDGGPAAEGSNAEG